MSSGTTNEAAGQRREIAGTCVVVERTFDAAKSLNELAALEAAIPNCFELRNVRWTRTYISRDKRRITCLYDAPDAEAVRYTQDAGGLPYDEIWTGSVLKRKQPSPRPEGYSIVVVEREMPEPLTEEQYLEIAKRASGCLKSYRVMAWESILSVGHGRALCTFYAPDADSVRSANLESGIPMTRAWTTDVVDAEDR